MDKLKEQEDLERRLKEIEQELIQVDGEIIAGQQKQQKLEKKKNNKENKEKNEYVNMLIKDSPAVDYDMAQISLVPSSTNVSTKTDRV